MYKFGVVVAYDCEDDKLRSKLAKICKDYGLYRTQFSVFLGTIDMYTLKELKERLLTLPDNENFSIFVQKVPLESTKDFFIVGHGKHSRTYIKKTPVV